MQQNNAYTVSQLTYAIKNILEGQKIFQGFVLKGEISNFTRHRTGHLYFALKDENATIKAIMFSSHAGSLKFDPKDGDKVTVTGSISVYPPQGSYSIQVTKMQMDGAGELFLKYLELKEKLKNLGWFDKEKRTLPRFPKNIGVVTSATGAVIEDITNTVNRRYRLTNIILYPALVQGAGASESVAKQIIKANEEGLVDCLIVGRGGGSIEDLWGFNELPTISAIYNSKIPVITAIGHETDDTLSDLVSDLRAPTPTAAAELATPDKIELIKYLSEAEVNIEYKVKSLIAKHQNSLMHLIKRLDASGPVKLLSNYEERLDYLKRLMNNYFNQIVRYNEKDLITLKTKLLSNSPKNKLINSYKEIENLKVILSNRYNYIVESNLKSFSELKREIENNYLKVLNNETVRLNHLAEILKKVNPLNIMQRGFTIVKNNDDKVLTSIEEVKLNSEIKVTFADGYAVANVISKKGEKQ
ncbi:MAG: exodeoxyribonuclease VII large subunit [Acholeplasma sp.]|nr:exodeoxyribonuclease VII large subunit [Acholeplasma sp.]